jgi:hypothetical protein
VTGFHDIRFPDAIARGATGGRNIRPRSSQLRPVSSSATSTGTEDSRIEALGLSSSWPFTAQAARAGDGIKAS